MLNRYLARFFCITGVAVVLASCGGAKAGGTGEFTTVFANANSTVSGLDSDVATWVDSTGAKAAPCLATSIPSVAPDVVNFNITSTAYSVPNTGSTSPIVTSDLLITRITLTYTPADSLTPALPALFQTQFPSAGQRISVGSNSIPIQLVSDDMKASLQSNLLCTGLIYNYRVNISFEALELTTNRSGTISLPGYFTVSFADFTDK